MNPRIPQVTWKIVERGSQAKMPSAFVEPTQEDSDIPAIALRRDQKCNTAQGAGATGRKPTSEPRMTGERPPEPMPLRFAERQRAAWWMSCQLPPRKTRLMEPAMDTGFGSVASAFT